MRSRAGWSIVAGFAAMLVLPGASLGQGTAPGSLPEAGTELEPGRYVSDLVGPSIDFRVGEGWIAGPSGNGPIFTLEYLPVPGAVLSVTRFDGEAFLDSCDSTSMTLVEPGVPRLTEIISGNPFLNPGPVEVVEVDGYSGLQVDVGVPSFDLADCALPYVLIWAIPVGDGGEFVQMADQQSRFVVLDVGGDVIVIAVETFPGVPFGGFLEASMGLIESMAIEPGEYIPPEPTPTAAATPEPTASLSPAPADATA